MLVNRRLFFSAFLLLLTHFCQGQNKMIAPSQPIIAAVGSNVVLPCQLDPVKDLEAVAVEWARHDLKPRYIHIRRDGIDLLVDQNSLYLGRTALSDRKLKYGDMSLELSRVKLSDNGTYRCYVPQMDTGAEVQLRVVSVSAPSVSLTKDHTGAVVLKCESRGWYPEPELSWLDSEGNTLAAGRTESLGALEELYSVSSKVTVEQSHGSTLTCRVSESSTKQSRETQINVADEFLVVPSCSVIRFLVSLVACLFVMTVVLICLWKLTKTKTADPKTADPKTADPKTADPKTADPEIGEREPLIKQVEKSQSLATEQQSEELQKIEKELEDVQYLINSLTGVRRDQLEHKEKLNKWIHQIKPRIDYEKKKNNKKKLEYVAELEKTQDEYNDMIEDINKQMKTTDEMIQKTTERKGKLERDKEQTEKLLKKRQEETRLETQRLLEENEDKAENKSEKVKAQEQTDEIQEKMDGNNESKTSDKNITLG